MAYASSPRRQPRGKLIHSNVCFLIVPAGLCAAAVAIRWLMVWT